MLGDEVMRLFAPHVIDGAVGVPPGTVLPPRPEGLAIACADGAVAFAELQLPGRRRMPAAAVLTGHAIAPGTVLA